MSKKFTELEHLKPFTDLEQRIIDHGFTVSGGSQPVVLIETVILKLRKRHH